MRIFFETTKFEKLCTNSAKAVREFGAQNGNLLIRRIQELQAARCLADLRNMPGRCHELTGNLDGLLSIDLKHPMRLLFRPEEPPPLKGDGGLDWTQVQGVIVCRMEDTHD